MSESALVEVDAAEWDPLLERLGCADAYLRRGYVEAATVLAPGRAVLLHATGGGGDVVFACIERDSPTDVTTPYGYGGPVAVGDDPPVRHFADRYEEWCAARGVTSTFAVYHPLFANHRYAGPGFRVQQLAPTIDWRLGAHAELRSGLHRHHRRQTRRAEAAGVTVTAHERPALAEFVALYDETMRRNRAAPFYFFPERYWHVLERRAPLVRFDARLGGTLVASVLCLRSKPWLHYHLGAGSEEGRRVGAGHLVLYAAAAWGRERDFTDFHLGGGVGGRDDALRRFKLRFDPAGEREAAVGKAIHDRDRYAELSGTRAVDWTGFFPAYRDPDHGRRR